MAVKKTALVTGCSPGGIGHAVALELHHRGLEVFATGRALDRLSDLKKSGIHCISLTVDDRESVAACHDEVVKLLDGQGLDYLINNAGLTVYRPAMEMDLDECKQLFGANLFGVMDMCQAFFPELLLAKGAIVNVGSVAGTMPLPFFSAYGASKAALQSYSDILRIEIAPLGVKVTYVQTGNVITRKFRSIYMPNEKSLWAPVGDACKKRQEIAATAGDEPSVFAKGFVRKVLGGHKDVFYHGDGSFVCWFISALEHWLPFSIWPIAFSHGYGMKRIGVNGKAQLPSRFQ